MFTRQTIREIAIIAQEFSLEPAALIALADVESGGQAFSVVDDRPEPLIRFEGHYFDARLTPEKLLAARAAMLAAPTAGAIPNPRTQSGRWRLLRRAAAIDRKAAYESVSWGLGQVMGAHWARLGYASVDELADEARSGAAGQARLMARYIDKFKLAGALTARDWHAFARGYNGPDYRRNRYQTRLAQAYRRYRDLDIHSRKADMLRFGSTGLAVRKLQLDLVARGLLREADGVFGRRTEHAVRDYQMQNGLTVDGIAGPQTLRRLAQVTSIARLLPKESFAAALAKLFKTV